MEKVDLLNKRKELTGEVSERNNVPEGFYRLSIHIWIMNDNEELLIQQRTANRKFFPNMWSNTGGAAIAGETSLETLKRELKEELNLVPEIDHLELIASYKRKKDFVDVWLLRQNVNIDDLVFQEDEVQGAKWVSVDEWQKMVEEGEAIKSSTDYLMHYLNDDLF